ncbi:phosphatidylglycerophosphatase A [Alkalilimnicola ehrlichii MLHE-1]|uniref:Phosphatidylglycerophosphatase A n=1 Tax=Alkalilimnicola ehrlichii (strain ATCC BAA-1101 / DSM 17681 / MLHE-1) TaxID=187272 RepID=Q0ABP3_ALKEH|nr:phosphatidylglycerophosphatase A [Alkalilimnicola ehrlichii]ABI55744.1 phosphatidylglycerophosphatase [Alkalilimnicola ehrlichii MLHE-1]
MTAPTDRFQLRNPWHFLALGFGSGLAPKAPGTFGTVAAIPVYLLLAPLPLWAYLLAVVAVCVAGVWICDIAAHDVGVHDHPAIVWDEIAGYLITMIAVPLGLVWVVAGFVLFRFFDILKPWPIRWLDRHVHGGLGIMVDDILAGVFALVVLHALVWLVG